MRRRKRVLGALKLLTIVGASGLMPAFILRCDKAALNLQRSLFQGLGANIAELIVDQVAPAP